MRELVFSREIARIPGMIREDGELRLELAAGAVANHDPRTFTILVSEAHLEVIRDDLSPHLLL